MPRFHFNSICTFLHKGINSPAGNGSPFPAGLCVLF